MNDKQQNGSDTQISEDKPLENPIDDRLGYAPFAERLAESIGSMASPQGMVLGIYGPWGSGKSTVLNFIRHYVSTSESNEQYVVVDFNPWWFSGQENLIRRFFALLERRVSRRKALAKNLAGKLGKFAGALASTPTPESKIIGWLAAPIRLFSGEGQDITELKKEIETALRLQTTTIVVVIDDIDRLTRDEVRQVFQLVKAVADFPKVIYVLAFDKKVVTEALRSFQGTPGEEYLEKIIQVPFELPLPDRPALRRLLFEKLDRVLSIDTLPEGSFDEIHWGNVYYEGLDQYVNTPGILFGSATPLA